MKRSIVYAVLAFGALAVSCSEAGLEGPREPGVPNATPVTVALGSVAAPVPVEATGTSPAAKAAAELTEGTVDGQVHDLWAIQYDADGKLVGTPYYTADIPAGTPAAGGSGLDFTYTGLSLRLTSSGTAVHTVCFVANTHNGSLFTADNDVTTLDKLKAVTLSVGTEYKPVAAGGIVMTGAYTGPVASGTPITGVKLERLAAKVVLRYKVSLSGFTVTGVRLRNVPAALGLADAPAGSVNFPAVGADSHIDYPAENPAKAEADGDYRKFVWYMPENISRAVAPVGAVGDRTLDKSDGRPAYAEVTGMLNADDGVRKATFRILLGDPALSLADFGVKRNHVYTVTLDIQGLNAGDNRVTVESFDMSNCGIVVPALTAGVARDSVTFDIRKLTYGWQKTMPALGTNADLRAELLWTDNRALVSQLAVGLDKVNGLLTVKSLGTETGNAVIALYDSKTPGAGRILWSWHAWVTGYYPSGIVKNIAGPLTPNSAYPTAQAAGQVHTYGREYMKANPGKVIMDRNLGATKSYNGRVPAAGDNTADRAYGLFYQWGRKDPFPRADGSSIDANTAAGTTIPIYGANGAKLDDEVSGTAGNGMRKVGIAEVIGSEANTLAYSVENPLTFIGSPLDWYAKDAANSDNGLWGDGAAKGPFDPCPKGWRVPPHGTWSDFTFDRADPENGTFPYYVNGGILEGGTLAYAANGRAYKGAPGAGTPLAWYPAAGTRTYSTGNLGLVGKCGYSWSSTPASSVYSMYLDFNMLGVTLNGWAARANSLQVRCVQE